MICDRRPCLLQLLIDPSNIDLTDDHADNHAKRAGDACGKPCKRTKGQACAPTEDFGSRHFFAFFFLALGAVMAQIVNNVAVGSGTGVSPAS